MEAQPRDLQMYATEDGSIPFENWLDSLKDAKARRKIKLRLDRVSLGNLGDYKSVGEGVCELRINYGSGYRVYFAQIGLTIILLLCGGDKSTQQQDIRKAQTYWRNYEKRTDSNQ